MHPQECRNTCPAWEDTGHKTDNGPGRTKGQQKKVDNSDTPLTFEKGKKREEEKERRGEKERRDRVGSPEIPTRHTLLHFFVPQSRMASLLPEEPVSLAEQYATGLKTFADAFPPFCISTATWDPTRVVKSVLPDPNTPVPPQVLDPRQAVQVCRQYYTESPADSLPPGVLEADKPLPIPAALQGPVEFMRPEPLKLPAPVPPGGAAGLGAPYSVWAAEVDREADLRRLGENLTKCKELRYRPQPAQLVADQTNVLPNQPADLAFPQPAKVLDVTGRAGCREADDDAAWNRSGRLFFNPTRQDRYHPDSRHGPLVCANPTKGQ